MQRLSPAEIPLDAVLIDVRDELEAVAAPLSDLTEQRVVLAPLAALEDGLMPVVPLNALLVVVCTTGYLGELAGAYLLAGGAERVSVLEGGVRDWRRAVAAHGL